MISSCLWCCGRSSDVLSQSPNQEAHQVVEMPGAFPRKDRTSTASLSIETTTNSSKVDSPFRKEGIWRSDIPTEMQGNLKIARWQRQDKEREARKLLIKKGDIDKMPSAFGERSFSDNNASPIPVSLVFHKFDVLRRPQENQSFCVEIPHGVIAGVLGGNCGDHVVNLAIRLFQDTFPRALIEKSCCPFQAFESTIDKIQTKVQANKSLRVKGSTGVFCFIDPVRQRVYTATIGNKEEASLYPSSTNVSIPLSVFRDAESDQEKSRIKNAGYSNPPNLKGTTRSLGLTNCPTVWHKPEITEQKIEPEDVLILTSPGVRTVLSEEKIINQVKQTPLESLPRTLVGSTPSSVVAIRICRQSPCFI